jgi:hypothetical protein
LTRQSSPFLPCLFGKLSVDIVVNILSLNSPAHPLTSESSPPRPQLHRHDPGASSRRATILLDPIHDHHGVVDLFQEDTVGWIEGRIWLGVGSPEI